MTLTDRLYDDADTGRIDPFAVFEDWFAQAMETEPNDPHAMALATVDAEGMPDVRMVLVNARNHRAFGFFTNLGSAKGEQLAANPRAAAVFHWKVLRRQVRIRGNVEAVTPIEADAYFASRHRMSQLGAYASRQSRPLSTRAALVARVEDLDKQFGADQTVPRPEHWSGYWIVPREIEFWKDGAFRLHDRVLFSRAAPDADWTRQRLYP